MNLNGHLVGLTEDSKEQIKVQQADEESLLQSWKGYPGNGCNVEKHDRNGGLQCWHDVATLQDPF